MIRMIQLAKRYRLTIVLLALWLVVQSFIEFDGGWRTQGFFLQNWGFVAGDLNSWRRGTWLSYAFLHVNWWHFVLNLVLWTRLALKVEWMLGSLWLLRVTLLTAISAAMVHALLGMSDRGALIGASGISIGILVFVAVIDPDARVWRSVPLRMRSVALGLMVAELFFTLVPWTMKWIDALVEGLTPMAERRGTASLMQQWFGDSFSESWMIGHACHIGGGLMGWLLAQWVMRPRVNLHDLQVRRAKQALRKSATGAQD